MRESEELRMIQRVSAQCFAKASTLTVINDHTHTSKFYICGLEATSLES